MKYDQGWREANQPDEEPEGSILHILWIAPLAWLLLWLVMVLF